MGWAVYVPWSKAKDSIHSAGRQFAFLNLMKYRVAGIPLVWKIVNLLFVVVPQFLLWFIVCWEGFRLLMETSAILDLVLGAMSLTFVLSLDEMVLSSLGTSATKYLMNSIEPYYPEGEEEDHTFKSDD